MNHCQPYLSAAALGVEEWERNELIALASRLLNEDVGLDMTRAASDCGSVGCVGGHMALAHGMSALGARRYVQDAAQADSALAPLFFPDLTANKAHPGWRARPVEAVHAILNFLTTGAPDWDGAMGVRAASRRRVRSSVMAPA